MLLSLVALLKKVPRHLFFPENWNPPIPPVVELSAGGNYGIDGEVQEQGNMTVWFSDRHGSQAFGENSGQDLGADLRDSLNGW